MAKIVHFLVFAGEYETVNFRKFFLHGLNQLKREKEEIIVKIIIFIVMTTFIKIRLNRN